jgi:hypothetical protein
MSIIEFALGAVTGAVVTVVSKAAYAWVSKQVTSVKKDASAAVASEVSKAEASVNKKV